MTVFLKATLSLLILTIQNSKITEGLTCIASFSRIVSQNRLSKGSTDLMSIEEGIREFRLEQKLIKITFLVSSKAVRERKKIF